MYFIFFLYSALGIITFDSSITIAVEYNDNCEGGAQTTKTISFSNSFINPPKIILAIDKLDINQGSAEYLLTIQSVTTSSFQLYIQCPQARIYTIQLMWYAIDDKRIEVINQFNINDFSAKTFPHQNPNFLDGFISLISFGFSGAINFDIQIDSISNSQVSTSIINSSGAGLISIGYQIILGTDSVITLINSQKLISNYNSPSFTKPINCWFMIPDKGLDYQNTYNIRLLTNYISQDPMQYSFAYWADGFTPITQQQIWLKYIPSMFYGLQCEFLTASLTNLPIAPINPIQIQCLELNLSLDQIGVNQYLIDKTVTKLTFNLQIYCDVNKQLTGNYNMCSSCIDSSNAKIFTYKCIGDLNYITIQTKFSQITAAYQQLTIEIGSSFIAITQKLLNQAETTIILQKIDIVPI